VFGCRYVIANDLSPAAAEAMRRNVEINGLGKHGKVRVNEGDAWYDLEDLFHVSMRFTFHPNSTLMYSHRARDMRADVVDLDPYGTAAPFLDAAVQCLNDKGKRLIYANVV
jgi:tRNA (guanine26-N2/guanine27-N2)-dimethyltransferase